MMHVAVSLQRSNVASRTYAVVGNHRGHHVLTSVASTKRGLGGSSWLLLLLLAIISLNHQTTPPFLVDSRVKCSCARKKHRQRRDQQQRNAVVCFCFVLGGQRSFQIVERLNG
jgi:hypothetical protein